MSDQEIELDDYLTGEELMDLGGVIEDHLSESQKEDVIGKWVKKIARLRKKVEELEEGLHSLERSVKHPGYECTEDHIIEVVEQTIEGDSNE